MSSSRRENLAEYFMLFTSVIPAMITNGFMPAWNVMPFSAWVAISVIGGGLAGFFSTPHWMRGIVAGAIAGGGIFVGIWFYFFIRNFLTDARTIKAEIVIGALIGWAPGALLYYYWARAEDST